MLDGLTVAKVGEQIRLVCPAHPTEPLRNGTLSIGGGPAQFSKHCSVEGCNRFAYSATEQTLNQEVQKIGEKIR